MKSDKIPYIIYADIETSIKKTDGCANSSTAKIGHHISCEYSMTTIWVFDNIEHSHTLCRREDCMKMFCTKRTREKYNRS